MVSGLSGDIGEWTELVLLEKMGKEDETAAGEESGDAGGSGDLELCGGDESPGVKVVEDGSDVGVLGDADSSGMVLGDADSSGMVVDGEFVEGGLLYKETPLLRNVVGALVKAVLEASVA